jgi:hypothetical protein
MATRATSLETATLRRALTVFVGSFTKSSAVHVLGVTGAHFLASHASGPVSTRTTTTTTGNVSCSVLGVAATPSGTARQARVMSHRQARRAASQAPTVRCQGPALITACAARARHQTARSSMAATWVGRACVLGSPSHRVRRRAYECVCVGSTGGSCTAPQPADDTISCSSSCVTDVSLLLAITLAKFDQAKFLTAMKPFIPDIVIVGDAELYTQGSRRAPSEETLVVVSSPQMKASGITTILTQNSTLLSTRLGYSYRFLSDASSSSSSSTGAIAAVAGGVVAAILVVAIVVVVVIVYRRRSHPQTSTVRKQESRIELVESTKPAASHTTSSTSSVSATPSARPPRPVPSSSSTSTTTAIPARPLEIVTSRTAPSAPSAPAQTQARALYAYQPQNDGEIYLKEGDVITVTRQSTGSEGWWEGSIGARSVPVLTRVICIEHCLSFPSIYVDFVSCANQRWMSF